MISLSASSSYAPLFCACHRPAIFFLLPVFSFLVVSDGALDWCVLNWDGVLAPELEGEVVDCGERHVKIFGIDGR
jgi:hypothetical protein